MNNSEERQDVICSEPMDVLEMGGKTFEIEEFCKDYEPKFIRNKKR